MLLEQETTAATVLGIVGWLAGATLVLIDVFGLWDVGELGLLLAGAGAVVQIRKMVRDQRAREDRAFRLGAATSEQIRQIH